MKSAKIGVVRANDCVLWTLLLMVAASQIGYCATRLTAHAEIARQRANSVDYGDYYATPWGERRLHRLPGSIAVQIEDGADTGAALENLTASSGLLRKYTAEMKRYGRIVVLKAPPVEASRMLMVAPAATETLPTAHQVPDLRLASPVFVEPESGFWMIPTGDIIVQLEEGVRPESVFGNREVRRSPARKRKYKYTLERATFYDIFAEVNLLAETTGVEWAEPGFLAQSLMHNLNDDYYDQLWHLHNRGQGGGNTEADVDAPGAWTHTTGSPDVVIAILDSGVQTNHPDLQQNIFVNTIESNGIAGRDDDNNGYVDDIRGWDFYTNYTVFSNGNNDPNPKVIYDFHGTNVAGVAAAHGNNNVGVAGIAYTSQLLPIRVSEQTDWNGGGAYYTEGVADAILYAAGINESGDRLWDGADILNISQTFPNTTEISIALELAATRGRNGKGCAIFCPTGNASDGWRPAGLTDIPAGTYTFRWEFERGFLGSSQGGTLWLDSVTFPDGAVEDFETAQIFRDLPDGWSTSNTHVWTMVQNGSGGNYAMTGRDGQRSRSVRPGSIGPGQSTYLQIRKSVSAGDLEFWYWPAMGSEELRLVIDGHLQDTWSATTWTQDAVTSIGYPASHPDTIAVGASTNFDYRADYSRYGTGIDFVAPGGGHFNQIVTTDRTGYDGRDHGEYEDQGAYRTDARGTSLASPLAAGVAALMLSKNPELTAVQIRDIMRETCDKLDSASVPYVDGRNQYYGYGRVNAGRA
ncbi:MAG: S8 family serine peptidase, partial [Phycisphaerales bacterium]